VPRIKSAKKALRQSRAHNIRNRGQRSELRNAVKRVRTVEGAAAVEAYAQAVQLLDRAARKGLIHPNNAARHKSRLAAALKKAAPAK
jgi:small subunit ribosomal protein S20